METNHTKLTTSEAALGGCGCLATLVINLIILVALVLGLIVLARMFLG